MNAGIYYCFFSKYFNLGWKDYFSVNVYNISLYFQLSNNNLNIFQRMAFESDRFSQIVHFPDVN